MKRSLQTVRGTRDIIFEQAAGFLHVQDLARKVAEQAGFSYLATPIFEFTDVFARSLGDSSDVVNKEMYSFEDRNGESLTLRPEFTAAVVRAFISGGWQQHVPLKLFSTGPLFRYERPQKGRMRQFHQVNYEYFGVDGAHADVEMMAVAYQLLSSLNVAENGTFRLNSLGDAESRAAYREALVAYFSRYKADLSDDSKMRLEKNPLRILDSKDEKDKEIAAAAPQMAEYYTQESAAFFADVQDGLTMAKIPFVVDPHIVRGLDYYNHSVFEYVVESEQLGAQNTILAGGRYDGLMEHMGGPSMPAVGFAAGIERLELLCGAQHTPSPEIIILPTNDAARMRAVEMAATLRAAGKHVDILFPGNNVGKKLKKADKKCAATALILGEEEMAHSTVTVKTLATGEQRVVSIDALTAEL